MIDILHRWTQKVVYHSETAKTIREAATECLLRRESLDHASLVGIDLARATFIKASLVGADLSRADLTGISLVSSSLEGASFDQAVLTGANLSEANMNGAGLVAAKLGGANLAGVDLVGSVLDDAILTGANLSGAGLGQASLVGANLVGAILRGAGFAGADLEDADLSEASLAEVVFRGANFVRTKGLLPNDIVPLQIGGSRNWIIVREAGYITIGCEHHRVEWWEKYYEVIGRREHYTRKEIDEYRRHIVYCREWMKTKEILEVPSVEEAGPSATIILEVYSEDTR